ncbi:unnamed protein product, partial [Phaeothamnion confervicola]
PPEHVIGEPDFPEPLLSPPLEAALRNEEDIDAARCADPALRADWETVYDSLQPPPRFSAWLVSGPTPREKMPAWHEAEGAGDDTLVFESHFESGNLRSAVRLGQTDEYNLMLSFDINTERHTQWFYFSVGNARAGRSYKLNLQNLMKPDSVYSQGMQPLAYSEREACGWRRRGEAVIYFKNQLQRGKLRPFYTLTFTFRASRASDVIYFAHCFPYRYTELRLYLDAVMADPAKRAFVTRRPLCRTLAGNHVDCLTITSPGDEGQRPGPQADPGVVLSARVHPGETNASWMMKGILDFLTGPSLEAAALRDRFVFKIVPMLNPDGVVCGNYRCSLAGADLNRQYTDPRRDVCPEVHGLRQMVAGLAATRDVALYVDLHGHSRKPNVFMYGCENPANEKLYLRERVVPTLLARASSTFCLESCSFEVVAAKGGCGRVVMREQVGIVSSFTMEASFMGADRGPHAGLHFGTAHFERMGWALCKVLLDVGDPRQTQCDAVLAELLLQMPLDMSRVLAAQSGVDTAGGSISSGSDDSDGSNS